ncbi:MAG: c-type cytochrome [Betaproteobacteria bacterium]|nr:c-type cytochrome [Betaproteobacteria bacterium]
MQKTRLLSFYAMLLAAAGMFWSGGSAYAADARLKEINSDPHTLRVAQEAGRRIAAFCANCHGNNGVSNLPEVPNLAGQNVDYLLEQTRKFGTGERKDPFMQGLIKALKEEEKIQLSLFYASQNPRPGKPNPASVEAGRLVFKKSCARCHGEKAHGNELIPRLASQHEEYLVMSVTRYRNKSGERQDPQMAAAVAPLKDADIKTVATYLSSLP